MPQAVIGVYRWINPARGHTHIRVAFSGHADDPDPRRALDEPIVRSLWMGYEELSADPACLRSPLVLGCIDDYRRGRAVPLDFLRDFA